MRFAAGTIGAFLLPELAVLTSLLLLLDDSEDSELSDSAELSDDELLELAD